MAAQLTLVALVVEAEQPRQPLGEQRHLGHAGLREGPGGEIKSPATIGKGVHLAKVMSKRGTYRFVCVFHPTEMRLKLVVVR